MNFRSYSEVTGPDRSDLLGQVVAQRNRVANRLKTIGRVVAVMSGKGGVGKSYITAMLARGAGDTGQKVGVLDADLKSPTCARMLGAHGPVRVSEDGVEPAVGLSGIRLFSTDLLLEEGKPLAWREPESEKFIWRGVLETGALREFLSDVVWGDLDILLVDLPPGGDRLADLAALVPGLSGAVAVTIPSEESHRSVQRSIHSALDAKIRLLGVVENMSGYSCSECGHVGPLFEGDAGTSLAKEFGVPVLGRIPFAHAEHGPGSKLTPATELVDAFLQVLR
jgi:ATP-binding protein involved in chromosome partitioning